MIKMTGEAREVRSDKRKPGWPTISINQHQSASISINQHQSANNMSGDNDRLDCVKNEGGSWQTIVFLSFEKKCGKITWVDTMTASTALKTRVAVGRPRLATAGFTTSVRMCLWLTMRRRKNYLEYFKWFWQNLSWIFSKSNTYDSPSVDVVDDDNNAGYIGGGKFGDDWLWQKLLMMIMMLGHPNPRRGMTKIKALVAFQCRRSWSIAVRCFSFKITICRWIWCI